MKHILIVPDGAADLPLDDLDGKTPLQVARTPYLDDLAQHGVVGMVQVTPPDMYPGSDAANMALLGYDPREFYTGRGPVEAAAMQIPMDARDAIFRCSLVATDGEILTDYSAGHVSTADARELIELGKKLLSTGMRLYPGVQYRHILQWYDGPIDVQTNAPHENMDRRIEDILPVGDGESRLRQLIWDSLELLNEHPYNRKRIAEGQTPANLFWPWGQGRAPNLPSFSRKRGLTGAVISGVDVVRGLGRMTGLEVIHVPGATGYFDTDYAAKGRAALKAMDDHHFVWVHVEAPDEAGHAASIDEKIKAIECIDKLVVKTILDGMIKRDEPFKMLVVPDHATPISTRGHLGCPVPYLFFDSRNKDRSQNIPYDERAAEERVPFVEEGYKLIEQLLVRD